MPLAGAALRLPCQTAHIRCTAGEIWITSLLCRRPRGRPRPPRGRDGALQLGRPVRACTDVARVASLGQRDAERPVTEHGLEAGRVFRAGVVGVERQVHAPVLLQPGGYAPRRTAERAHRRQTSTDHREPVERAFDHHDGNTAVGALGEDTAGLLGATMLNLLSLLIGQQVLLPAEERTPVTVLIDESSTLAGVDYQTMLSELPKYGGAFVMVTQSLAKLDAIDPTLVQTILSNIDGLTAFQCSAEDAARLAPQLGEDVSVEDLIALDDFTACVRWWDGRTLPAPFTFRVNPPPPHNQTRQRDLAARSALEFGRDRAEVAAAILRVLDDLMSRRERPPAAASELRTPADPGTELAALQPPWSVP